MEAQEIFDTVVAHLRNQGKPARGLRGCSYRTSDGLMCAVGCLIQDDEYKPEMDSTDPGYDNSVSALYRDGLLPERLHSHLNLLGHLQVVHDRWEAQFTGINAEELAKCLAGIATERSLNPKLATEWLDDLQKEPQE